MLKRLKLAFIALLISFSVYGCAGLKPYLNVINSCEIPQQYDYVASGPLDLPKGITAKQFIAAESVERHDHKTLADDFNGFHDYVKGKCNGS